MRKGAVFCPFLFASKVLPPHDRGMIDLSYTFEVEIWLWHTDGATSWHFVTLPPEAADEIRFFARNRRGFGSLKVDVTIGRSHWATSIFPDKKSGSFVLPLKKAVRVAESITAGDTVSISLHVRYDPE